jgi:hypothetical protein
VKVTVELSEEAVKKLEDIQKQLGFKSLDEVASYVLNRYIKHVLPIEETAYCLLMSKLIVDLARYFDERIPPFHNFVFSIVKAVVTQYLTEREAIIQRLIDHLERIKEKAEARPKNTSSSANFFLFLSENESMILRSEKRDDEDGVGSFISCVTSTSDCTANNGENSTRRF